MPYVTSIERLARQKGRQEGLEEGLKKGMEKGIQKGIENGLLEGIRTSIFQALQSRFGELPEALHQKITRCTDADLPHTFHQPALTAGSLDELRL